MQVIPIARTQAPLPWVYTSVFNVFLSSIEAPLTKKTT